MVDCNFPAIFVNQTKLNTEAWVRVTIFLGAPGYKYIIIEYSPNPCSND